MRTRLRLVLPIAAVLLAAILVAAIVLDGSGKRASSNSTSESQANGGFVGAVLPGDVRAPDFTLTEDDRDQHPRTRSLSEDRGHVVVLVFMSSTCRACVLVAQQVRGALDELTGSNPSRTGGTQSSQEVRTIFVSTDPKRDTPAGVASFLGRTSLSGRVEYLTGSARTLRAVWRAYGLPTTRSGGAGRYPAAAVLLIDRRGAERVELGLEQLTPESLAHDVRRLIDTE